MKRCSLNNNLIKKEDKMKNEKFRLMALTFLGFTFALLLAQETNSVSKITASTNKVGYPRIQDVIPVAGTNASGSNGSISITVGQLVDEIHTGTNGSLAQGVQEAYVISTVTALKKTVGISLQCSLYPNPARDFLILKIANKPELKFNAVLIDMAGRQLQQVKIDGEETSINMSAFVRGSYLLKVIQENKEIKVFKIIKN
jgi:hypothetical protein